LGTEAGRGSDKQAESAWRESACGRQREAAQTNWLRAFSAP
jgi:hypothetical protein